MSQAFNSFKSFSSLCFQKRYGFSFEESKYFLLILQIFCITSLPFYSYIVNNFGKRIYILLSASLVLLLNYLFMMFLGKNKPKGLYFSMFILGNYFSAFSVCTWTGLPFLISKKNLAFGYGFFGFVGHSINFFVPNLVGAVIKSNDSQAYQNGIFLVFGFGVVALFFGFVLFEVDRKRGGVLSRSEKDEMFILIRNKLDK